MPRYNYQGVPLPAPPPSAMRPLRSIKHPPRRHPSARGCPASPSLPRIDNWFSVRGGSLVEQGKASVGQPVRRDWIGDDERCCQKCHYPSSRQSLKHSLTRSLTVPTHRRRL